MLIKTTRKYHYTPTRLQNMEEPEHSIIWALRTEWDILRKPSFLREHTTYTHSSTDKEKRKAQKTQG